jgi:hypothetical protein
MAKPAKSSGNSDAAGCAVVGALIGLILLIGKCAGDSTESNVMELMNASNAEMGNAIAAQEPPPAEPLNAASVRRGVAHLRLAVGAESFSGAMVYSQNCYDALSRQFTWAKLDQCGAADMLAARSIESVETSELTSEEAYFRSEAAAGRYLAAATGAGQPAPEADTRLSELQRRAARERLVGPPPAAPAASTEAESEDDESAANTVADTVAEWLDNVLDPVDEE